jgi:hypothetical protein
MGGIVASTVDRVAVVAVPNPLNAVNAASGGETGTPTAGRRVGQIFLGGAPEAV